jgi:hypothetical protein
MNTQEYDTEIKVRREKEQEVELDEVYETMEEEEEAELEYRDKIARQIRKAVVDEEQTYNAIEGYHDEHFYPYVCKQSIIVWIKWYKTRYIKSDYISADDAEKELYLLQIKYNKYCNQRDWKIRLAKLRKEY